MNRIFSIQLFRYGLMGSLASIVNIGLYWVFAARIGRHPNLAWTIGFIVAVGVGYIVHSRWSFGGHRRRDSLLRAGSRFAIISIAGFGLNSFFVWLLVTMMGWPTWAPYPLILCVTPLTLFWFNRRWVFN